MLIVPYHVKKLLEIKYNYIYIFTIIAYIIEHLIRTTPLNAVIITSTRLLLPLYALLSSILFYEIIRENINITQTITYKKKKYKKRFRKKWSESILVLISSIYGIAILFLPGTMYLFTHLFRQTVAVIMFLALLILIPKLTIVKKKLTYKHDMIYAFLLVIVIISIGLSQVEGIMYAIVFISMYFLLLYITDKEHANIRVYFYMILILGLLFVVGLSFYRENIVAAIESSINGIRFFVEHRHPIIWYAKRHINTVSLIIFGSEYFFVTIVLLLVSVASYIYIFLKKRYMGPYTLLSGLIGLVALIVLLSPLPDVLQYRALLYMPFTITYIYPIICITRNAKMVTNFSLRHILLTLFLLLVLLSPLFYVSSRVYPRWTTPYIKEGAISSLLQFNQRVCHNSHREYHPIIFVEDFEHRGGYAIAFGWYVRNWIVALIDCKTYMYYGRISDLLKGVTGFDAGRVSAIAIKNAPDVAVKLRNSSIIAVKKFKEGSPVAVVVYFYEAPDLYNNVVKNRNCHCQAIVYPGPICGAYLCRYTGGA